MKIFTPLALCACLASLAPAGFAQDNKGAAASIFGHLDPKTGMFKPLSQAPVDAAEAAPSIAPTTGKFVANITINIASTNIPANAPLSCSFSATSFDVTTSQSNIESASVPATRSGSTATCTVTIPYSWQLGAPTQDSVSLSYGVSTATTTGISRYGEHSLATIKVPANGATTTETLSTTL